MKSAVDFDVAGTHVSPSPRRAWIEINVELQLCGSNDVALPTEGVD